MQLIIFLTFLGDLALKLSKLHLVRAVLKSVFFKHVKFVMLLTPNSQFSAPEISKRNEIRLDHVSARAFVRFCDRCWKNEERGIKSSTALVHSL